MFYVYQHRREDSNDVFYVGKGVRQRFKKCTGRNSYWHRVVDKHGFKAEIVANDLDEELAFFFETELIDLYRRDGLQLVNMTDGGEGASGYKHTDEHKDSMKGNSFGAATWGVNFKGSHHSDEQKARWSEARKGAPGTRNGVILSDEIKAKMSASKKDKPLSEEHRKAISNGLLGNRHTAKLTDDDVRFIRANQGVMTHVELGEKFGVHKNTIHKIWRNERYKDIV